MLQYFITKEQMKDILFCISNSQECWRSYLMYDNADNDAKLAKEIEQQAIITEHLVLDDELVRSLALNSFRMGVLLDRLEDTLDVYENHYAKELLDEIKWTRNEYDKILGKKIIKKL